MLRDVDFCLGDNHEVLVQAGEAGHELAVELVLKRLAMTQPLLPLA